MHLSLCTPEDHDARIRAKEKRTCEYKLPIGTNLPDSSERTFLTRPPDASVSVECSAMKLTEKSQLPEALARTSQTKPPEEGMSPESLAQTYQVRRPDDVTTPEQFHE